MSGVMSKVAFASKISVLMKTTSDDATPTPGYLYADVTKISYESVCTDMLSRVQTGCKRHRPNFMIFICISTLGVSCAQAELVVDDFNPRIPEVVLGVLCHVRNEILIQLVAV